MRLRTALCLVAATLVCSTASGQTPPHQHPVTPPAASTPASDSQHAGHAAAAPGLFSTRDSSGTAWLPDASPMYGVEIPAGSWSVMLHGNAFVQFLNEGGTRAAQQGGSINWAMAMARRRVASGRLGLRTMLSLEPWTIPGCGYPDLLATGEACNGEPIHDRQHPHDLVMELAAEYRAPLAGTARWQIYGGLAGEPALGPAAFPHRMSSMPNPLAPISHHWIDATHITFGVVTAGVFAQKWKVEGSMFNGREPDDDRTDLDLKPFDSVSGRVWFLPTRELALQISAGHLEEAEAGHALDRVDGTAIRVDVDRLTASASYQRPLGEAWQWASTIAFGRNHESGNATSALLLETSFALRERDTWFGRFEWAEKSAADLDVHDSTAIYDVAKLQLGYTAYFPAWRRLTPGFGGSVSVGFVPPSLAPVYGHRANPGIALFLTIRPAAHHMQH
jgi:hypothetical protein